MPPSGMEIGLMDFPIGICISYFSSIRAVVKSNQKRGIKKHTTGHGRK
jgi:hypothetical protein